MALMGGALLSISGALSAAAPVLEKHQVALKLDSAGTAWMIVATALVLMMTVPGLGLFYGGMVRRKNVLSTLAQSVAATVIVTLLWFVVGYSWSFGTGPTPEWNKYLGGFEAAFLQGVLPTTAHSLAPGLPEMLFISYQLTFAIITPALIAGSFAERFKFSGLVLFLSLWSLFVYAPVAHWVWGGGFLGDMHVLDFAGGAVVHVNSGVAGLVTCLVLGRRKGFGRDNMAPHNLVLTMIGASLLFVGWIGFNAGSANAANDLAATALLNTILGACAASVGWIIPEWIERKKPTLLGMVSGIVAGLVAITPAAGFVTPASAVIIGLVGGLVCYISAVWVKKWLGYDDSLDAFGVHGVGGAVGALLTGLFATAAINPAGVTAAPSVLTQAIGLGYVIAWSAVATFVILMIVKFTIGLRVSEEDEIEGLDTALHDEGLHN